MVLRDEVAAGMLPEGQVTSHGLPQSMEAIWGHAAGLIAHDLVHLDQLLSCRQQILLPVAEAVHILLQINGQSPSRLRVSAALAFNLGIACEGSIKKVSLPMAFCAARVCGSSL